jgi:hypothetical protein
LAEIAPAADVLFELALCRVRANDWEGARRNLAAARRGADETGLPRIEAAQAALALLATAVPEGADVAQRITLARAALALQHPELARTLLAPVSAEQERHLALAVTAVKAELGAEVCPQVRPGLGNGLLCAAAWRAWARAAEIETLLTKAWQSGNGRDAEAIESALGLRFVVPLLFLHEPTQTQVEPRLVGLTRALSEVAAEAPPLAALHLFAQIVERAVLASGQATAADKKAWKNAVLELHRQAPQQRQVQAAVLGLATWLAPSEDVTALLDVIAVDSLQDPQLLAAWIKLNASAAVRRAIANASSAAKRLCPLGSVVRPRSSMVRCCCCSRRPMPRSTPATRRSGRPCST